MNRLGLVLGWALCLCGSLFACDTHEATSSGSNWLQCDSDAECALAGASSCDREGYCLDEHGDRFVKSPDARDETGTPEGGIPPADANAGARDGSGARACPWTTDAMLKEVGVPTPKRVNCGRANSALEAGEVETLWQCFEAALDEGAEAVEASVNLCYDCVQETTFVATSAGEFYALERRLQGFGSEGDAVTATSRCEDIAWQSGNIACLDPSEVATCAGDAGMEYPYPPPGIPVTPQFEWTLQSEPVGLE